MTTDSIETSEREASAPAPITKIAAKGAQADIATVSRFQLGLQQLCDDAEREGVVLTVDLVALQPLAMGNFAMHPLARPAWLNADKLAS